MGNHITRRQLGNPAKVRTSYELTVGGCRSGTVSGALVGALAIVWLPELSKDWASSLPLLSASDGSILAGGIYGLLLIVVVFVMPGGIVSFIRRGRARLVRFT